MPQCPNCQTEITEDFGLITCSKCGVSLMIGIDGEAQLNSLQDEAATVDQPLGEMQVEHTPPSNTQWFENVSHELTEPESDPEPAQVPMPTFEAEEAIIERDPVAPQIEIEAPAEPQTTASVMQEVTDFANSDSSLWNDGNIRYKVTISDIDSVELKSQLAEVLSDQRFAWNAAGLIASIEEGILVIEDMTAPKAFVLINALKPYRLNISWEQNVLQTHS